MGSLKTKTKKQLIKEIEKLREQIKNTDIKGNEGNIDGHISSGEDITKRNQTEDALRQYDRIISATNDHMSFLDRNYIYQTVNEAYLQAHQKAWDEIVGHSVADLLGVDIFERLVKENLNRCLAGEEIHYQSWFDFPGLGQRYMDVAYYPYFETDGEISGVVVSSHDITERKRAEEALKESEERYKGIIQSTVSCVAVFKPVDNGEDFIFVDFNSMAEKVEKISKEKVIGKKVTEIFPGVIEFGLFKVFQDVWKTGKPKYHPALIYKDDRIQGYRENYIYKLSSGEIVAVYQDLTERRQTEEKLRESEERMDLALKGTGVGTWDWGIQTDEIIYNERWAEIIGYTLEELSPINTDILKKFTHPDDLKKSNALIKKHFSGESDHYECEVRMKHKNGNWIWILDRGKVFEWNKDGKPIRMVGTHLDITAQKKIEEERERVINLLEGKIGNKDLPEGFIPMCAGCHKIRDENKQWHLPADYLSKHTNLVFTHGICPDCVKEYYGEDLLKKINYDKNK